MGRGFGVAFVLFAEHRRGVAEAVLVHADAFNHVQHLVAVIVVADDLGAFAIAPGIASHQHLLADHDVRHAADVVFGAIEGHDHQRADNTGLWCAGGHLAADLGRRRDAQLLRGNQHPHTVPSAAMAGVDLGRVERPHPLADAGVDVLQGLGLFQLQSALELLLDDVVSLLDLPLGAGVADLVDDQLDAQGLAQVAEHRRLHGSAGVGHQHERHTVERVLFAALLHGADQDMADVLGRLGAQHVLDVDGAAGVVGDDVAPEALTLDLLQVLWFAVVVHGMAHGPRAVVVQVELGGDRGVDLPNVVRVLAGQADGRCWRQNLRRVQVVLVQSATDGTCRHWSQLAGRLVDGLGTDDAVTTQARDGQFDRRKLLVVGADAQDQERRDLLQLVQRNVGCSRVGAAFARLVLHGQGLQFAIQGGEGYAQARGSRLVDRSATIGAGLQSPLVRRQDFLGMDGVHGSALGQLVEAQQLLPAGQLVGVQFGQAKLTADGHQGDLQIAHQGGAKGPMVFAGTLAEFGQVGEGLAQSALQATLDAVGLGNDFLPQLARLFLGLHHDDPGLPGQLGGQVIDLGALVGQHAILGLQVVTRVAQGLAQLATAHAVHVIQVKAGDGAAIGQCGKVVIVLGEQLEEFALTQIGKRLPF
ncbi:hypothetical protein D9M71_272140 [compost metagenome]